MPSLVKKPLGGNKRGYCFLHKIGCWGDEYEKLHLYREESVTYAGGVIFRGGYTILINARRGL